MVNDIIPGFKSVSLSAGILIQSRSIKGRGCGFVTVCVRPVEVKGAKGAVGDWKEGPGFLQKAA